MLTGGVWLAEKMATYGLGFGEQKRWQSSSGACVSVLRDFAKRLDGGGLLL